MEYRFVTADDQRAIAEQRARQLELDHFRRRLEHDDAVEHGDVKAASVIAEDLAQREATIVAAVAAVDKLPPREDLQPKP